MCTCRHTRRCACTEDPSRMDASLNARLFVRILGIFARGIEYDAFMGRLLWLLMVLLRYFGK